MTPFSMFFGLRGRIPRTAYWFALVALAGLGTAIYILAGTVVIRLWPAGKADSALHELYYVSQGWGGIIAIGLLAYPALALAVKRAHDCDIPALVSIPVTLAVLPYPLLTRWTLLYLPASEADAESFLRAISPLLQVALLALVLGFAGMLAFGLLPATQGHNRFGPPPRGELRGEEPEQLEDIA